MKPLIIASIIVLLTVCSLYAHPLDEKVASTLVFAESQLRGSVAEINTESQYRFPRWVDHADGKWRSSTYNKWTSGFFPGCLWYMYYHTGHPEWRDDAARWTSWLEEIQYITSIYTDLGFSVVPSYVHGFLLTRDRTYIPVILTSAESYAGRWNDQVKVFECWDKKEWLNDPTIISGAIDQLMNLDIFFNAFLLGCDKTYYDIATQYAQRVMQNNVREDYSIYQSVRYDLASGDVVNKGNIQGYTDSGKWARGQGWATYGFTMVYRYTRDKRFLNTAIGCANFFIDNLPEDAVPYWDFTAPNIPNEPKDAAGSAIVCSALFELIGYVKDLKQKKKFETAAFRILNSLTSEKYMADPNTTNALLLHCTGNGNKPETGQVNSSQIYADYYFLEAMLRYQAYRCRRGVDRVGSCFDKTKTDIFHLPQVLNIR